MNWDEYFINMARYVAKKSKDPSTKVGTVIVGPDKEVVTTGYNGFPRGVRDDIPARWERPEKYKWCEHSERNAIYNAARIGSATKGCVAYMESPPCIECGRALIQAGIVEVVLSRNNPFKDRADWQEEMEDSIDMLEEAGVVIWWTDI